MQAHGGALAVAAAQAYGVDVLFTLSGGHVFPLYDGAVKADPPMRIVDVRHEQTAVFAAEAYARLTRRPGLAVLTAGPGVTNGVSAVTTAHFNATPLLVIGGRAPDVRWGMGSLQELDHPPILAPVTKHAATVHRTDAIQAAVADALDLAASPRRGPVFLDVPMDVLFSYADLGPPRAPRPQAVAPDEERLAGIAARLNAAERPVVVAGSDVWLDRAEAELAPFAEAFDVPVVVNGMGRGCLAPAHRLSFSRVRGTAFQEADLVVVIGTPLDFRLGFGDFGGAAVVHLMNTDGALAPTLAGLGKLGAASHDAWVDRLRAAESATAQADEAVLTSDATPVHPARVYGELRHLLDDDAVVVGDGGDFVSYAGRHVAPKSPGCWLDPGPYGCLGTGLGYAAAARVARPGSQVVLLLGDGAAGFSLLDVDTLVRHDLPVVMVCGNNGVWGLEKHPMQFLYGYDVAADLQPGCRYDQVVAALGGHGELVTDPGEIRPAIERAFASGRPALVNVLTDPAVAYPRSSNLA